MTGIRSLWNVVNRIPMWLQIVIVIFALIALEQICLYFATGMVSALSEISETELAYLVIGALGIFVILAWICLKEPEKT